MRIAIVTLDNHLAGATMRAAATLRREMPGLTLTMHSAAEWGDDALDDPEHRLVAREAAVDAAELAVTLDEDLRRAVRWLSEHHQHDIRAIEEASIRFDLSPLDEEFLIQHCVEREGGAN